MEKKIKKVELLAPAGNMEAFFGAIHAGADAVYLAGKEYGARALADNFTRKEICECLRYAHLWKRKVYLTVNTLVKEEELARLTEFLTPLADAGLDGVIVQDFGVFSCIRENFPSLPLHVSTQMTVTGPYGAKLMGRLGAVRIVPARELSLSEIIHLKEVSGLEVECFIHGAMCYCYSGQCLFSSILGGRSGNRGRCAQPCRLPYAVEYGKQQSKECFPLSMKDLCTIEKLPELIRAGIDSFKIEGRMKKPEYAAGVTALYRKYIDRYYDGLSASPSQEDLKILSQLYIRSQVQDGYYDRKNGRDMITLDSPGYNGSSPELLSKIREKYITAKPKMDIRMKGYFQLGKPARIEICRTEGAERIVCEGEPVEAAVNAPVTGENISKQLRKLGDTVFRLDPGYHGGNPEIMIDEGIFYSLKSVNELRRAGIHALEEAIINE